MPVAASRYWNAMHGSTSEEVLKDEEGLQTIRVLGRNMAFLICAIHAEREHGGEPSSVKFCAKIGMNYASCSPFRVPIARLAAAQAAVEE